MTGTVLLALRAVTALALYAFLVWAFLSMWKGIKNQAHSLAGRRVPGLTVRFDPGDGDHTVKHFSAPSLIIGRDPGSDIWLKDDTVSTRHAQLTYHHNQWWIVDLSSTNGTTLNGFPVNMSTVITTGDEIKCGTALLRIGIETDVIVTKTRKLKSLE